MATANPTRVFEDVDYYLPVAFECGYFDVVHNEPSIGLNLIVTRKIESYQERNFEDRVVGELRYARESKCHVYSTTPMNFAHLRHGKLRYQGVARGDDFGPFHAYLYELNPQ